MIGRVWQAIWVRAHTDERAAAVLMAVGAAGLVAGAVTGIPVLTSASIALTAFAAGYIVRHWKDG